MGSAPLPKKIFFKCWFAVKLNGEPWNNFSVNVIIDAKIDFCWWENFPILPLNVVIQIFAHCTTNFGPWTKFPSSCCYVTTPTASVLDLKGELCQRKVYFNYFLKGFSNSGSLSPNYFHWAVFFKDFQVIKFFSKKSLVSGHLSPLSLLYK